MDPVGLYVLYELWHHCHVVNSIIPGLKKKVEWSMTHAYKPMHLAGSNVTSRVCVIVFALLYMSNSNNLKALCIPHEKDRTKFFRKKKWKASLEIQKNNNVKTYIYISNIPTVSTAMFTVFVTFVNSRCIKLFFFFF